MPAHVLKQPTLVLLGSGELGREVVISAKRLGCKVVAIDSYAGAPAMQVADASEVVNMLDGDALEGAIRAHIKLGEHAFIVPEIEAIRTERLLDLERAGFQIIPSARAAHLTMNRDAIRELAATTLKMPTARFAYANSADELRAAVFGSGESSQASHASQVSRSLQDFRFKHGLIGVPCVIKPVMSSSGKGQSVARDAKQVDGAWEYAVASMRGDTRRVIVEEFIKFDYEITLLTVRQRPIVASKKLTESERTLFCPVIGHRQERGDYQESWMPCAMPPALVKKAQSMARAITSEIAGEQGAGLFGVEFFVVAAKRKKLARVIFSELSPRPHDTGMVTMIGQDLSEFDLHVRAILGLPIPAIRAERAAASAVILASSASMQEPSYVGIDRALALKNVEVRLFGKPTTREYRRMGVALARANSVKAARALATKAASLVRVVSNER